MQASFEKEFGMRLGRAAPPAPAGGGDSGGGDEEDGGGTGWGGGGDDDNNDDGAPRQQVVVPLVRTYFYDGHYFGVPQGYQFPKANLKEGLRYWLNDQVVSGNAREVVNPFMKMSVNMFPEPLRRPFRTNWMPIFKFLDPVLKELPVRRVGVRLSEEEIQNVFNKCVEFLKERVSYLWKRRGSSNPTEFTLGTWSNRISRSWVMRNGSESDIALLGEGNARHQGREKGAKRKRDRVDHPKYPERQERRIRGEEQGAAVPALPEVGVARAIAGDVAPFARRPQRSPAASSAGRRTGRRPHLGAAVPEEGGGDGTAFLDAWEDLTMDGGSAEETARLQRRMDEISETARRERLELVEEEDRYRIAETGTTWRQRPTWKNFGSVATHERQRMVETLDTLLPESPPPMMTVGRSGDSGWQVGRCCVDGCSFPTMELRHQCNGCRRFIHMLCVERFNDLTEDVRYCNECIKNKKG